MSPSNNVRVQILSLHGSYFYIAVEQNLELKALGWRSGNTSQSAHDQNQDFLTPSQPVKAHYYLTWCCWWTHQMCFSFCEAFSPISDYLMLMQLSYHCPLHVSGWSEKNITNADLFCILTIPYWPDSFHLRLDQPKKVFLLFLLLILGLSLTRPVTRLSRFL